uniref:Uncharacterized protein n=1 Tax=Oryza sativa subsp. japonica TaxID=39947 RepID=Q6Z4A5_ORYSJ|nr:hypothetical protein [Oryza sativa Japonica Group]
MGYTGLILIGPGCHGHGAGADRLDGGDLGMKGGVGEGGKRQVVAVIGVGTGGLVHLGIRRDGCGGLPRSSAARASIGVGGRAKVGSGT